jgi:hypothetical protein
MQAWMMRLGGEIRNFRFSCRHSRISPAAP